MTPVRSSSVSAEGEQKSNLSILILSAHTPWSRICPGRYIAEASIWIQIVMALACLKIEKPLGEELEVAFTSGLLRYGRHLLIWALF